MGELPRAKSAEGSKIKSRNAHIRMPTTMTAMKYQYRTTQNTESLQRKIRNKSTGNAEVFFLDNAWRSAVGASELKKSGRNN